MIKLTIKETGIAELRAQFGQVGPRLSQALARTLGRLALEIERKVKIEKLSGQVLKVRTGRLRRSITHKVEGAGTPNLVARVGTNVEYAAAHEYGFRGTQQVKAHLRTITQAWGRPIRSTRFTVRAHPRQVNLPERSFLRSALREMGPRIESELSRAAVEAMQKK